MKETAMPSSLASEAYEFVKQRILRGNFTMGQVISRRKIAAELGMSFLPVSEALLRLEFEGLLESRPRAGTRVRIPSPEDVRGHYIVREALEVQASMLFAAVATEEDRIELQALAARVDAMSATNQSLYLPAHEKLHRRIAGMQVKISISNFERRSAAGAHQPAWTAERMVRTIRRSPNRIVSLADGALK